MKKIVFHSLFYLGFLYPSFAININSPALQNQDSLKYYYNLANYPKSPNDLQYALDFYLRQKKLNQNKKDTITLINNLRQIAIIQLNMGFYFESESTAVETLKAINNYKNINDEPRLGLYNHLGRIYRILKDYDVALDFYKKAESISQTKKNLNIIQNNIAYVYQAQEKYELAEKKYQEIYQNSLKIQDSVQIARSMANLAHIKGKLNKSNALELMKEALDLRLKINDSYGIYSSYDYLYRYYRDKNDLEKAKDYANKALTMANELGSTSYVENALSNLVELDESPNIVRYKRLKDSLSNAKQIAENKYALYKYNYFESEKLAKENEIQKEKEKRLKQLYQVIGAFILMLSAFLYFILKSRYKKGKIEQIYKTETRISKKVHDEVANEVYHVMTKLQDDTSTKDEVLDDLEDIYAKTREISKENSTIDFNENFETLLNDLLLSYKDTKVNVMTRNMNRISWNNVSEIKKTAIYRVLQELMTNMKKHSNASITVLTFSKEKANIIINYKDDGVGGDLKKKSGLQNAENRILSVNGTIIFESEINKGFKATIKI